MKNHKKLEEMVNSYYAKYGNQNIMESISQYTREKLWDQIMIAHITFLSMETRDLVLNHLFRFDSRIPGALSRYYYDQLNQDISRFSRITSLFKGIRRKTK